MDKVKAVRKRFDGSTVNDVILAALIGALRRYGAEERNDPKLKVIGGQVEFKALMMVGLPRELDEKDLASSLCNSILFTSVALPIDRHTPEGRMLGTIDNMNK